MTALFDCVHTVPFEFRFVIFTPYKKRNCKTGIMFPHKTLLIFNIKRSEILTATVFTQRHVPLRFRPTTFRKCGRTTTAKVTFLNKSAYTVRPVVAASVMYLQHSSAVFIDFFK